MAKKKSKSPSQKKKKKSPKKQKVSVKPAIPEKKETSIFQEEEKADSKPADIDAENIAIFQEEEKADSKPADIDAENIAIFQEEEKADSKPADIDAENIAVFQADDVQKPKQEPGDSAEIIKEVEPQPIKGGAEAAEEIIRTLVALSGKTTNIKQEIESSPIKPKALPPKKKRRPLPPVPVDVGEPKEKLSSMQRAILEMAPTRKEEEPTISLPPLSAPPPVSEGVRPKEAPAEEKVKKKPEPSSSVITRIFSGGEESKKKTKKKTKKAPKKEPKKIEEEEQIITGGEKYDLPPDAPAALVSKPSKKRKVKAKAPKKVKKKKTLKEISAELPPALEDQFKPVVDDVTKPQVKEKPVVEPPKIDLPPPPPPLPKGEDSGFLSKIFHLGHKPSEKLPPPPIQESLNAVDSSSTEEFKPPVADDSISSQEDSKGLPSPPLPPEKVVTTGESITEEKTPASREDEKIPSDEISKEIGPPPPPGEEILTTSELKPSEESSISPGSEITLDNEIPRSMESPPTRPQESLGAVEDLLTKEVELGMESESALSGQDLKELGPPPPPPQEEKEGPLEISDHPEEQEPSAKKKDEGDDEGKLKPLTPEEEREEMAELTLVHREIHELHDEMEQVIMELAALRKGPLGAPVPPSSTEELGVPLPETEMGPDLIKQAVTASSSSGNKGSANFTFAASGIPEYVKRLEHIWTESDQLWEKLQQVSQDGEKKRQELQGSVLLEERHLEKIELEPKIMSIPDSLSEQELLGAALAEMHREEIIPKEADIETAPKVEPVKSMEHEDPPPPPPPLPREKSIGGEIEAIKEAVGVHPPLNEEEIASLNLPEPPGQESIEVPTLVKIPELGPSDEVKKKRAFMQGLHAEIKMLELENEQIKEEVRGKEGDEGELSLGLVSIENPTETPDVGAKEKTPSKPITVPKEIPLLGQEESKKDVPKSSAKKKISKTPKKEPHKKKSDLKELHKELLKHRVEAKNSKPKKPRKELKKEVRPSIKKVEPIKKQRPMEKKEPLARKEPTPNKDEEQDKMLIEMRGEIKRLQNEQANMRRKLHGEEEKKEEIVESKTPQVAPEKPHTIVPPQGRAVRASGRGKTKSRVKEI